MTIPELIWTDAGIMRPWRVWTIGMTHLPEYIRADLVAALVAEAVTKERERIAAMADTQSEAATIALAALGKDEDRAIVGATVLRNRFRDFAAAIRAETEAAE